MYGFLLEIGDDSGCKAGSPPTLFIQGLLKRQRVSLFVEAGGIKVTQAHLRQRGLLTGALP